MKGGLPPPTRPVVGGIGTVKGTGQTGQGGISFARLRRNRLAKAKAKEEAKLAKLAKTKIGQEVKAYGAMAAAGGFTGHYLNVIHENIEDIDEEIEELKRRRHEAVRAGLPKKRSTKKAEGGLVTNFKGTF